MAWLAGSCIYDDRLGITLGGNRELFGEQEIQVAYVIAGPSEASGEAISSEENLAIA